jgi:hypothetical protein
MTQLVVDDAMLTILSQAKGLAEVRDGLGRLVGFYAPAGTQNARLYAQAASRIDPEEIKRRKAEPGPYHTTREVFEHPKSQTQDEQTRAYLQNKIDRLTERDECATP